MKKIKKLFIVIISLILLGILSSFIVNLYVKNSTKKQIETIDSLDQVDAIIVLGASVRNGSLSPMLRERLITGIELYQNDMSDKIIMSGDHSGEDYDEVTAMQKYAIENGVEEQNIILDHFGISTYDSIYRAKYVFNLKKVVIVTQKYHLYRALYIANNLGLDAVGIDATKKVYIGQDYRDLREYLARSKDFVKSVFKPKSVYLDKNV